MVRDTHADHGLRVEGAATQGTEAGDLVLRLVLARLVFADLHADGDGLVVQLDRVLHAADADAVAQLAQLLLGDAFRLGVGVADVQPGPHLAAVVLAVDDAEGQLQGLAVAGLERLDARVLDHGWVAAGRDQLKAVFAGGDGAGVKRELCHCDVPFKD